MQLHRLNGRFASLSNPLRGTAQSRVVLPPGRTRLIPAMVFTGIVQGMAEVTDVDTKEGFSQVKITFPHGKVDNVKLGASVAVNGTCLTVTDISKDTLGFDIIMETLRATNLGELGAGSVVNFERAAKLGDEIGGHYVSGHVHTSATISNVEHMPNNRRVTITPSDEKWMKYILPKGYIAVDGTSLTIGEVYEKCFTIYLIPETLRATVFGIKSAGDTVNLEVETQTQAIVDTVEKVVAQQFARLQIAPSHMSMAAVAQQQQLQQPQMPTIPAVPFNGTLQYQAQNQPAVPFSGTLQLQMPTMSNVPAPPAVPAPINGAPAEVQQLPAHELPVQQVQQQQQIQQQ